jgi:hypothetical protein
MNWMCSMGGGCGKFIQSFSLKPKKRSPPCFKCVWNDNIVTHMSVTVDRVWIDDWIN